MSELERHVEAVVRQRGRRARRAALLAVPRHLRDRVRMEVEYRWSKNGRRR